jgi:hypothetical protein
VDWQSLIPQRGLRVLPRRWVVERTFSWLGQNRRMSKYYERLCATGEAFAPTPSTVLFVNCMNIALIVALIGAGGSLLGVVGTATVARYAQVQTNRREEKGLDQERKLKDLQQNHELDLKRLELESTKFEKRREERVKAYRDFLNAVRQILSSSSRLRVVEPDKRIALATELADRLGESYAEVSIVGPSTVTVLAYKLQSLVVAVGLEEGDNLDGKKKEVEAYRNALLAEVSKDSDIPPGEIEPFG